ncbi:integrin alpha-4-like [Zophobas morio]|uniref:integrin alpha-4-like n=1 Tax=Zophobas morio TaxID=2755281 RepID=UPI003082DF50
MLKFLVFLVLCNTDALSFLIDYPSTKMLTINETNSYFGYSILLQKGNRGVAIIGAPRKRHGSEVRGSVFKCDLLYLRCSEYSRIMKEKGIYPRNRTGDFLGSVLDGDEITGGKFFTCAPKFIIDYRGDYYLNGRCFYVSSSSVTNEVARTVLPLNSERQISSAPNLYYDAAFGESGFDIAYIKDKNILLTGAPGKSQWNGALVRTSLVSYTSKVFSNEREWDPDSFFGYAVAWGKFIINSPTIWYVSGSPRATELKGKVVFYEENRRLKNTYLLGEQYGSYFGASLLVIHKNQGGDDILVGAPLYPGNSWDEGCVYYYKNRNDGTFYPPIKLSNKKSASRFGTTLAKTGDMDLDGFTDCAIAAPYEDDGVGAVYIYFGTHTGFVNDQFLRISPSDFATVYPKTVIKGFGVGISNGNDINNDKHNDLAIGAYQSGQVFYFTTKQIFDVTMNMTSSMKILYTSTTNFSVTYCIKFTFRNGDRNKMLSFFTRVILDDDRILNRQNITKITTTKAHDVHCTTQEVLLKKDHLNVDPLIIPYGYRLDESQDQLTEDTFSVPVSYECGEDNICQTNLTIKSLGTSVSKVIFGINNEAKVNVEVSNFGESAYQTKLYLKVLPEVSLINLRECDFENGSYVCLVARVLNGKVKKSFLFDLANLTPNYKEIPIHFKVESVGNDADLSDNELQVTIPVNFQNNPYLDSRSLPEKVFLNKSEEILKITHTFLVGNQGPSPLNLSLTILVPQVNVSGIDILEIKSTDGTVNGIESDCKFSKKEVLNATNIVKLQVENDTKVLSCVESLQNCVSIVCKGAYVPKSNKNAAFTLKLTLHIKPTVKFLDNVNKLVLMSSALFSNDTTQFYTTASTYLYTVPNIIISMPLWIYLVSVIVGVILLMLLIFTLYKCNFFKRTYKEMIENEQTPENMEQREILQEEEEQEI